MAHPRSGPPGANALVVEGQLSWASERVPHLVPTRGEMGVSWREARPASEVAHPAGAGSVGLGFSSPVGVGRGSGHMGLEGFSGDVLNQLIENAGYEAFLRRLRAQRIEGVEFRMVTETGLAADTLNVRTRRYTVHVEANGESREFLSFRLTVGEPPRGTGPVTTLAEIGERIYLDEVSVADAPWASDLLQELELPVGSGTPLHDEWARIIRRALGR